MHEMRSDLRTGIIAVDFIGFWRTEDLEGYKRDIARHVARLDAVGKRHMLLIDHTRAAIQSQEMIAALSNLALTIDPPAQRIAIFSVGPFARLQAKRIAALRDNIRVFADRDGAIAWLSERIDTPRPAIIPAARRYAR